MRVVKGLAQDAIVPFGAAGYLCLVKFIFCQGPLGMNGQGFD